MDWMPFTLAFAAFFASHALPVRPPVKARISALIGARGFTLAYSALSVAVLSWLLIAAYRAPYVELWPPAIWQRHLNLAVMGLAVAILALAIGRPNPLSFGGSHNDRFDPARPGIVGWMRHPLLIAIGLWAAGHLIANGDLAHVLVFGTFLAFALLGQKIIDRRKRRQMGADWARLTQTARRIEITPGGLLRLGAAAMLYALLLWAHPYVIGVSPLG